MNGNRYHLIHDREELKRFHRDVMPPLKEGEVYFFSLSARAKYLTESERKELNLGRTEMFCRNIVRTESFERFFRTMRKFEVAYGGYTTKNNSNIPEKAIVVYTNINPSSVLKSYSAFQKKMTEYVQEISICAQEGRSTKDISYRMSKMDTLLMNSYQQNTGTKHWIDIDFDIDKSYYTPVVENFLVELKNRSIRYVVIDTRGGYHVMIDRSTLNYNYNDSIKEANEKLLLEYIKRNGISVNEDGYRELDMHKETGMEIVVNKNDMIPTPGTLQAGHPVRILDS